MHPLFSETMVRTHERELERSVRRSSRLLQAPSGRPRTKEAVLLRLTTIGDAEAIERLSLLEGVPEPDSRCVVAEVDGTVVAALPLRGGTFMADPFRPTAHLVPLLELRAEQLAGTPPRSRRGPLRGLARALGLA